MIARTIPAERPTQLSRLIRLLVRPIANRAAAVSVAGADRPDAIETCRWLRAAGVESTVGYWNRTSDAPDVTLEQNLAALEEVRAHDLGSVVSLKAHALGFDRERLDAIASRARHLGVSLAFDSGPFELVRPALAAIEAVAPTAANLCCALPGRWRRSVADAEWAIARGFTVRVVKGQWPDPDEPGRDVRAGFLDVVDALAGRAAHVRVATHDASLAKVALERLLAAKTSCELELLVGLPAGPAIRVARMLGVPLRGYVAYGDPALLYPLRAALGDPHALGQIVRSLFGRSDSAWMDGTAGGVIQP